MNLRSARCSTAVVLATVAPVATAALVTVGVGFGAGWVGHGPQSGTSSPEPEAKWPAQRALLQATIAGVELPQDYEQVACAAAGIPGDRCWRVRRSPSQALPDLTAALEEVVEAAVVSGCELATGQGEDPLGCSVTAPVAGRIVGISVLRDLPPGGERGEDLLADTSTVAVGADLTPP